MINILVLCSTNKTANENAKNLEPNINHIIATHFNNSSAEHKFFYVGLQKKIKHDLENRKCKSYVDTLIEKCNYAENQFDIIITNNCPNGYAKAIFTDNFFKTISYLLKNDGIFSYINFTNDINTIDFKFNKKIATYNYGEFNDKITSYALKHIEKYKITGKHENNVQIWHSIQKKSPIARNNSETNSHSTYYSLSDTNSIINKPEKINILILCATDSTASHNPTHLQANIDKLINTYFTKPNAKTHAIQQLYYIGNMLTHNLQNNKCKSSIDNMIINCGYTPNMFDIILSEYCPLHMSMSVFNDYFFKNINHLLKDNGIISWKESINNKKYTFNVGNNKQTSQINYIHADFYNMLLDKYHLIYDGLYNVMNKAVAEQWCIIKKGAQINKINNANVINTPQTTGNNVSQPIHNVNVPILSTQVLPNIIHFINY